jgi:23S rRNA (pseudouridine1915-N3)-methyltransferase
MDSEEFQAFPGCSKNFFYEILDNSVTKSTNSVTKTIHSVTKIYENWPPRSMKITFSAVAPRRTRSKSEATDRLLADYIERTARYVPCDSQLFESEAAVLDWLDRQPGRTPAYAVLLDSRGQQYSSEEFAAHLGRIRDEGIQRLVLGIGPADGWSPAARQRADLLFSLGRITLPHQLARVVLAEQVYRALTILAGHPYHSGH